MKRFLLLLLLAVRSYAANAMITWDANTEADLAGYWLYVGDDMPIWIDAAFTQKTLSLSPGNYTAVLTAVNFSAMESAPSAPLVFKVLRVALEGALELQGPWQEKATWEIIATEAHYFYRVKIRQ